MSAVPHEIYQGLNEDAEPRESDPEELRLEILEAAEYISVLLLQMRLIAKHAHLDNLLVLLEDAYYCAFATAHPPKVIPGDESEPEGD